MPNPTDHPALDAQSHSGQRRSRPWVPIRSLSPRHRDRIASHLLALADGDRYLRFGYPANDAHIQRYVDGIDFERDEVFGIFNRRLRLIALAHLAFPVDDAPGPRAAEFGGSVEAGARGQGFGARLFEHAMLHTRNRGLGMLFIHALSENTVMLRIARQAGGVIIRAGGESDVYIHLPPETLASRVEQWVGDQAAEVDYRLKRRSAQIDEPVETVETVEEVRTGFGAARGHPGSD